MCFCVQDPITNASFHLGPLFQVKASQVRFYRHLVIKAKTMPTPLLNLRKMEKNTLLPRPAIHLAIHLLPCE